MTLIEKYAAGRLTPDECDEHSEVLRKSVRALLAVARTAKKAKRLLDRHSARLLNVDEMLAFISEIETVSARLSRVSGKGESR